VNSEYADAPVDEPGNDDLGAISSWYVWAALGFFPVTPGSGNLALASPLFPSVTLTLPDGRRLVEHAPGAAASRPFVHALTVTGVSQPALTPSGTRCAQSSTPGHGDPSRGWDRPWLPASVLQTGASLSWTLSPSPDPTWASSAADRPPSSGTGQLPAVGFSSPSGATSVAAGQPTVIQLGAAAAGTEPTTVRWQVTSPPNGLAVSPSSGTLTLAPACGTPHPITQSLTVSGAVAGTYSLHVAMTTSGGLALPPVVLDVVVHP
jgi:hypothetical protein